MTSWQSNGGKGPHHRLACIVQSYSSNCAHIYPSLNLIHSSSCPHESTIQRRLDKLSVLARLTVALTQIVYLIGICSNSQLFLTMYGACIAYLKLKCLY